MSRAFDISKKTALLPNHHQMTYPGLNPDWFGEIKMTLSKKVKHFIINETFTHFAANRQKQNFNSFNY